MQIVATIRRTFELFVSMSSQDQFDEISENFARDALFSKIFFELLLPAYKSIHKQEVVAYEINLKKLATVPLGTIGVRKKFRLTKESLKKKSSFKLDKQLKVRT